MVRSQKGRGYQRHEHYLRPVKGSAQPKQALAIEAEAEVVPHPSCEGVQIERLRKWWLCRWEDKGNGPEREVEESGTDSRSFWSVIERILGKGVTTWVFALPASRVLGLLSFWEMLEQRKLYTTGRDYRDASKRDRVDLSFLRGSGCSDGEGNGLQCDATVPLLCGNVQHPSTVLRQKPKRARQRQLGYLVLEDPPTVAQVRMRCRAGSLRIVDLRNYGYSGAEAPKFARERCWWIRQTAQAMIRTLREQDLGGLQNTASSQAFTAFKKRFLNDSILVHCDPEALHLERQGYYGGRTEAVRIGPVGERVWLLDFKSFYPAMASVLAVPIRLVGVYDRPRVSEVHSSLSTLGAFAQCRIATTEAAYPLRRRHDTIYPIGEFWTYLAGPELKYALDKGHVTEIERVAYYEVSLACSAFALGVASLRESAECRNDRSGAEFLKRLGVALYGKFAQSSALWLDTTEALADHPFHTWIGIGEDNRLIRYRAIGWEVQREHKYHPGERPEKGTEGYDRWRELVVRREAGESIPSIAGYITSSGRILLWSAIRSAGEGNVYYYDTDSLFVNRAGLENLYNAGLVCGKRIGRLSIRAVSDNMVIHGYKHYEYNGNVLCSGMPKGECSPAEDNEHYYLRAWIGRSLNEGTKPQTQRARRVYERSSVYRHGQVNSEGRVIPWKIGT